jgi:hypothetical protein
LPVWIGSPALGERANPQLTPKEDHGELKTKETDSPKPAQTFRSGSVQAAVWQNVGEKGLLFCPSQPIVP